MVQPMISPWSPWALETVFGFGSRMYCGVSFFKAHGGRTAIALDEESRLELVRRRPSLEVSLPPVDVEAKDTALELEGRLCLAFWPSLPSVRSRRLCWSSLLSDGAELHLDDLAV